MFVSGSQCRRRGPLRVPDTAALLLIDCQPAFTACGNPASAEGAEDALNRAAHLAEVFRSRSLPVLATRHAHSSPPPPGGMGSWWNTFLEDGDPDAELDAMIPRVRPLGIFRKESYSALEGTGLPDALGRLGTDTLVLCGFLTHVCVDSTARQAFQLGFDVIVASDACASVSRALHEASLLCLAHAVARVATVGEIERALEAPVR